jgi:hypothetical protein
MDDGDDGEPMEPCLSPAADLADLSVPPPLDASLPFDLPALAEVGGASFLAFLSAWEEAALGGTQELERPPLDTVAQRVEAVLTLLAEGQARRILAGSQSTSSPPADAGAIARQRGALTACCATLRIARPANGETPVQTLARLRTAAAEKPTPSAVTAPPTPSAVAAPPTPSAVAAPPSAISALNCSASSSVSGAPLVAADSLTVDELVMLDKVAEALNREYETRRAMLLKRLDVLISGFGNSERGKEHHEEMRVAVDTAVSRLPPALGCRFTAADAFSADASLLELQRAVPLATQGAVKKVRIGGVPDRGGRANEAYCATQTFAQQERERDGKGSGKDGGGKGGHGRGSGGGGKGGRGKGGGSSSTNGNERIVTIESGGGGGGGGAGGGGASGKSPRKRGGGRGGH